jgi:cysteine synthase
VFARPVNIVRTLEAECCSFSSRIPGVADALSKLFSPEKLPGLMTVEVDDEEAMETTRKLIRLGYPVGPSSGLNFVAAVEATKKVKGPVVTVFPDRMERYFTTELFRQYV